MLPKFAAALGVIVMAGACATTTESINPAEISNQDYNSGKFDDGSATLRGTDTGNPRLGFVAPVCDRRSLVLIAGNRYCDVN